MQKPSPALLPLTVAMTSAFFLCASSSFSVKPLSVPLGTTHSSLSTAHMPVLGCSNMSMSSLLSLNVISSAWIPSAA